MEKFCQKPRKDTHKYAYYETVCSFFLFFIPIRSLGRMRVGKDMQMFFCFSREGRRIVSDRIEENTAPISSRQKWLTEGSVIP